MKLHFCTNEIIVLSICRTGACCFDMRSNWNIKLNRIQHQIRVFSPQNDGQENELAVLFTQNEIHSQRNSFENRNRSMKDWSYFNWKTKELFEIDTWKEPHRTGVRTLLKRTFENRSVAGQSSQITIIKSYDSNAFFPFKLLFFWRKMVASCLFAERKVVEYVGDWWNQLKWLNSFEQSCSVETFPSISGAKNEWPEFNLETKFVISDCSGIFVRHWYGMIIRAGVVALIASYSISIMLSTDNIYMCNGFFAKWDSLIKG